MSREKIYKTQHRRRREGRTDYRQRLRLLKSRKPRFIVRKSNNNFVCQVVEYQPEGDRTVVNVFSADIKKLGWKGHCGNLSAAYLTGLLCGAEAKKHKVTEAVLDMGLHTSSKGSSVFAALKGAVDSGLKIPHSEESLPAQERISGKHIAEYKKNTTITKNFEEIKNKILKKK